VTIAVTPYMVGGRRAVWDRPAPLVYAYTPDCTPRQRMGVERALARWQQPVHWPGFESVTLARPYTHGDGPGDVAILVGPAHLSEPQFDPGEFSLPAGGGAGGVYVEMTVPVHDHLERVRYRAPKTEPWRIVGAELLFQYDASTAEIVFAVTHGWGHLLRLLDHSRRPKDVDVMRDPQRSGFPSPAELRAVRRV